MLKSPKTTVAGIAAILAAVAGAASAWAAGTPIDWTTTIAAVMAGIGLVTARDNDKRSEDVGAGNKK